MLVSAVLLYKEHLVKYFCHLALAHVQYNLYDNVFALLCLVSSPSPSSLSPSEKRGWRLSRASGGTWRGWGRLSACPGGRFCLIHLQPPPPSLELPEKLNLVGSREGRCGGGARMAPSARSLAIVVLVRQNFVVFFPFYGRF